MSKSGVFFFSIRLFSVNCKLSNESKLIYCPWTCGSCTIFDKSRRNFHLSRGITRVFFQFSIFCTLDRLLSTSTDISRKLKVVIIYYIFFTVHSEVKIALCESENRIETHFRFLLAKRDTPEEGKVWKINHRKYRDDTEIFFNLKTFVHTRESIRNGRLSFVVY